MKIVFSVYVSPNYIPLLIFSTVSFNFNRCADCFQSFSEQRFPEYSKCRALNCFKIKHARINGTVRILCKTRVIFPRINGPIMALNINVIEDDCQFLGVLMRLSTRCEIWFTLGLFANYFL